MAYETGAATSQGDLLDKLNTFVSAHGWTTDVFDLANRKLAIHKGTVFGQLQGDGVAVTGSIAVYHSLSSSGFGTGTDDSGNGQSGAGPYTTGRRINHIGNGPFTAYHFFVDGSYCHVALEYSAGLFRHFAFGKLDKVGDWTGGEYGAATFWDLTATGLDYNGHNVLFDWANTSDVSLAATVHMENLGADFQTTEKFGVVLNIATTIGTSPGTDRGGLGRLPCIGGWRDGFYQSALGWIEANPNNGYVPMFPLQVWRTRRATTPQQWMLLGHVPDIRFVNINYINPGDEFTVGGDTWKCFPFVQKSGTTLQGESGNLGVAYKKVV